MPLLQSLPIILIRMVPSRQSFLQYNNLKVNILALIKPKLSLI
jgi:hypothetical protein